MIIVGYFHICQKPGWKIPFDLIMDTMKQSKLYNEVSELRLSVLSDRVFEDDERFHDPKMRIVYKGKSEEYERPTLLHIKSQCTVDSEDTRYFYVHTKGLSHFNTEREPYVMDWIKLMVYWNIERWPLALEVLSHDHYWTYGCNHTGIHYSGNFWWSKPSHIQRLSSYIPDYYTAPEDWVTMLYWGLERVPIHYEYYNAFKSGLEGMGHYSHPYPESNYRV